MRALRMLLLAIAFAATLYLFTWWTVPLVGAAYALLYRRQSAPWEAGAAALVAMVALLIRQMLLPAFSRLMEQLGQIFPVSGVAVIGLTLLLAALLAFTGARVMSGIVGVKPRTT